MTETNTGVSYIIKLTVVLFLITAITSGLLGLVNAITKDEIDKQSKMKTELAMSAVVPKASSFEQTDFSSDDGTVSSISLGFDGGELQGYAVTCAPIGYGGAINMAVGVDTEGRITGISIISMTETAGFGSKAASEPWFLEQYIGLGGVITVGSGDNSIDALTGATVTSTAVTNGVNSAAAAVNSYLQSGGSATGGVN